MYVHKCMYRKKEGEREKGVTKFIWVLLFPSFQNKRKYKNCIQPRRVCVYIYTNSVENQMKIQILDEEEPCELNRNFGRLRC